MTTSKETHPTTQHTNPIPTAYQKYHMKKTEDWLSDRVCASRLPCVMNHDGAILSHKNQGLLLSLRKAQLLRTKLPKPNWSCACHMEPKMQLQQ